MRKLWTSLLSRDIDRAAAFYRLLGGFIELGRTDTYVLLGDDETARSGLTIIDWVSELVPKGARGVPEGSYLTLVVDDIEAALDIVRDFEVEIMESPTETGPSGRAVVRDIDGRIVEIVTPDTHLVVPPRETVA
ncbi:MAG: VOC family protein [Devosia sp.]